jgi:transposase-like protein
MEMREMRKSRNDWRAIVMAYKTSGQTQSQWCQANNVNLNNLRYWLQKDKPTVTTPEKSCQWLTLEVDAPEATIHNQQLTLQIGPVCLRVNPGFNPQFLIEVVKAIIAAC